MSHHVEVGGMRALAAGAAATLAAASFFVVLAPAIGLGKLDNADVLGKYFAGLFGAPYNGAWLLAGWAVLFVFGLVWGEIYAAYFCDRLLGPGWLQGLTFGAVILFMVSSLVFFPALGALHPGVRAGTMPVPGLLGAGLIGDGGVAANFLGHCVYGMVVGALCRPKRRLISAYHDFAT